MDWMTFISELSKSLGLGTLTGAVVTLFVTSYLTRRTRHLDRVNDKKCEAISKIHGTTYEMMCSLQVLATPDYQGDEEFHKRRRAAEVASAFFREECQRSRIWLDPSMCKQLDDLWMEIKLAVYVLTDAKRPTGDREAFLTGVRKVQNQLPAAIANLESRFRKALGSTK